MAIALVVFNSVFTFWVWLRWLCSTLTLHFYDVGVAMVMLINSTIFTLGALVLYTRHGVWLPLLTKGGSG